MPSGEWLPFYKLVSLFRLFLKEIKTLNSDDDMDEARVWKLNRHHPAFTKSTKTESTFKLLKSTKTIVKLGSWSWSRSNN